jgi:hypothetical protein
MAISVNDQRLLEGSEKTLARLQELQLQDAEARAAVQIARGVLQRGIEGLRRSMNREDIAALLSGEMDSVLKEPKSSSAEALSRAYYSIQKLYAERRTKGEPVTERDEEIRAFLDRFNPSDFINTSLTSATSAWDRASEVAGQYIPEEVKSLTNQALERARQTRGRLEEAGQNALKAFSDLEKARESAKSDYLAARELTSAALRMVDRYDELNDIVPPVSDIMSPS